MVTPEIWCPWCNVDVQVINGRIEQHTYRNTRPNPMCRASGLTPNDAQDEADDALTWHAATGE